MNKEEILQFCKHLGITRYNTGGRSIVISCPLARWTHAKSKDFHPSCSIFIEENDMSCFNCFTCHNSGTMSSLVRTLHERMGGLEDLIKWVDSVNKQDLGLFIDRALSEKIELPQDKYRTFNDDELSNFINKVPKYAIDRGINLSSCKSWGLGYDNNRDDPRLIFPVRDHKNKLVGIVGRTIKDKKPRYKNYFGFHKEMFLYGEHLLDYDSNKPFIIVEGMIDPIIVKQNIDVDCVAQMGSFLSEKQAEKVISFAGARPVILMYDGDEAGDSARAIAKKILKGKIGVIEAIVPRGKDPASIDAETLKNILKMEI
jgi:5S rRNA maturation endonuclease (ribonuclease M5)